jgi:NAD(P)-dependent dehydrogenase (short-subunit alcohol dehydrogenase family)
MTKSLAQEWGPGIRVNCLALGPTITENFRNLVLGQQERAEDYFRNVPIRRGGEPEEVGDAVVFLCAGRVDVINGTTIEMDGGMLPGVLYDTGLEPIRALLANSGLPSGRSG